MSPYTELHTSSAFSFLDGASLPAALIERAAELGYSALALLDRDGLYGAPQFYRAARAAGLKAIVGAELTMQAVAPGSAASSAGTASGNTWTLPVLVSSAEGYRQLCRIITQGRLRAAKGEARFTLDDFAGQTSGLVALVGREALWAGRHGVGGLVDRLVSSFGRTSVWIELQRHLRADEQADIASLLDLSAAFRVPVMASGGVRFATADDRPLYDVFTCLRHKTTLRRAGRLLSANAERYLRPPEVMARLFSDLPQALAGTEALAERLEFTLEKLGYRFPEYPVPAGETQVSFLRRIAQVGARDRYRPYHDRARAQIARELDLIEKLDLAGYFLIVWDIVNFCRQEGILVQGRGSAANSAVCYALGITAVDPVGMDLLFERFLSEERGEWPDIDLDLPSGERRERVIQHVYQRYGTFGAAMTANVISYRGRSATREVGKVLELSADEIDRVARLMGQFEFVDPDETFTRNLREAGLDADDPRYQLFGRLWREMQDLPRHLGQHSGGMVLCQGRLDEVVPLEPASMPGRVVVQWDKDDCADLGIIKVDLLGLGMMAALEDAITIINATDEVEWPEPRERRGGPPERRGGPLDLPGPERRGGPSDLPCAPERRGGPSDLPCAPERRGGPLDLPCAAERRGGPMDLPCAPERRGGPSDLPGTHRLRRVDLAHLPPDDPDVYHLLQTADTVGVFQVESRAQMATLPRLKPKTFYDLVVEVAIIRPGPIVGKMVHPYLARRAGTEPVTYAHPLLEPVLARTLGVPLFQEQLLRMAMVVAGFSGGEAEELRRAMGFKRSIKRMQQIEQRLRDGMAKNGITDEAADAIVLSITSFALYGFPESHAASFALIVYASAYLKTHYPAAFYTALLNNQPMGFYHPATLVKDAQRRGVRFLPVDVQTSGWNCRVEPDGAIRMGLRYVRGLRDEVGTRIERAEPRLPRRGGLEAMRFVSMDDLVQRIGLRQDEMRVLAEVGALSSLGGDRRTALWQAEVAGRPAGALLDGEERLAEGEGVPAEHEGEETPGEARATRVRSPLEPMSLYERVQSDYDGTGLTIGPHPMAIVRQSLATRGVMRARDLARIRAGRHVRVAGAVITRQRPGTANGFVFLSLEDETGIANVIVTPDIFAEHKRTIVDESYLLVEGPLQNQQGALSVKAERVMALSHIGPSVASHDFH